MMPLAWQGTSMNTINPTQLILNQLHWRYATKQFDPARKIPADQWTAIEEALTLTPSSYGLQPWKFIVVTDPEVRGKLLPHSWGQPQIVDASHLVVFSAKKDITENDIEHYLDQIATTRSLPRESLNGFRQMLVGSILQGMDSRARKEWAARQAYIALGNFLNVAALTGIDACPMEGFIPAKYDEILGLEKEGLTSIVVATAGYRAESDKAASEKKVRFAKEELFARV